MGTIYYYSSSDRFCYRIPEKTFIYEPGSVLGFVEAFPRFSDRSHEQIKFWLNVADIYCPSSMWGELRPQGLYLVTAHFLEMLDIQDIETGGKSIPLAAGTGGGSATPQQDDFSLTTWGRQYLFLRSGLQTDTVSPRIDQSVFTERKWGIGFAL